MGRIAEAVEAYQKSIVHQRLVYSLQPGEIKHRDFLDERFRQVFWLLLALGRRAEAVQLVHDRKALWRNDFKVAMATAGQLAIAALLPLNGESVFSGLLDDERRNGVVEAMVAACDATRMLTRNHVVVGARP